MDQSARTRRPVERSRSTRDPRRRRTRACPAARSRSSSSRCCRRRGCWSSATRRSQRRSCRSARSSASTSSPWTAGGPEPASGDLALVVAAHGRDELHTLRRALEAGVPYVGLVASRKRGAGVIEELRADGVSDEHLALIDVPAGIDIGSPHSRGDRALDPRDDRRRAPRQARARVRVRAGAGSGAGSDLHAPPLAIDPICGMTVAIVRRHAFRAGRRARRSTSAARAARPSSRRNTSMPSQNEVTGEAAGEIRRLVPDIETLARRLADVDYLVDEGLATSLFLSVRLPQPLLLEGEAGVGKTEAAKSLALVLDTPLVRLQCYEGIDAAEALYEWNYPRQLLSIRLADARGTDARRGGAVRPRLSDPPAAAARARASRPAAGRAADRRDRPRRRRLRGVPARAARRGQRDDPRDRHDPRHASADHRADLQPDARPARRRQAPLPLPLDRRTRRRSARSRSCAAASRASSETLAVQVANAVSRMRDSDVQKPPGIAEAIDWLAALSLLGIERLDAAAVDRTLGLGAEVQRGPGGGPRGRPRAARARR